MTEPNIKQIAHPEFQLDEEIKKAHPEDKRFLAFYRKENERLQNLIARNQVAYESEINKIRAEHAVEIQKMASRPVYVLCAHGKDAHKPPDKNEKT